MSLSSLSAIAGINNQGCDFLDRGDFSSAVKYFRKAVVDVRVHYLETKQQQQGDSLYSVSNSIFPMLLHEYQQYQEIAVDDRGDDGDPATTRSRRPLTTSKTHKKFVIHSQAIRIVPCYNFSLNPIDNSKFYAAMIVFNLALTVQLEANVTSSSSQFSCLLLQAKTLYLQTCDFLMTGGSSEQDDETQEATGNVILDLLNLAVLNNIALIYVECTEYATSGAMFQKMLRYASSVVSKHQQFWDSSLFSITHFLLNAQVFGMDPNFVATNSGAA